MSRVYGSKGTGERRREREGVIALYLHTTLLRCVLPSIDYIENNVFHDDYSGPT